jgi:predicted adenine nucleotide alpha hydrolase (AANH) superfamily ATPase
LHICCGPCSTYSIKRLREQGFDVTGFWYNPNIHPFAEHERRRECIQAYAREVGLAMIEWQDYEMTAYFRAVIGHEAFGERCALCYRLRLECTAEVARQKGFDAFTTTLLISPYQQQALIRRIGEELAAPRGLEFYFENLRRGWSERGHMAREHHLYEQRYCGCIYSEWEAQKQRTANAGIVPRQDQGLAPSEHPGTDP